MPENNGEEKKIGLAGWLTLLIFLAVLAYAVYNKMTAG